MVDDLMMLILDYLFHPNPKYRQYGWAKTIKWLENVWLGFQLPDKIDFGEINLSYNKWQFPVKTLSKRIIFTLKWKTITPFLIGQILDTVLPHLGAHLGTRMCSSPCEIAESSQTANFLWRNPVLNSCQNFRSILEWKYHNYKISKNFQNFAQNYLMVLTWYFILAWLIEPWQNWKITWDHVYKGHYRSTCRN